MSARSCIYLVEELCDARQPDVDKISFKTQAQEVKQPCAMYLQNWWNMCADQLACSCTASGIHSSFG